MYVYLRAWYIVSSWQMLAMIMLGSCHSVKEATPLTSEGLYAK